MTFKKSETYGLIGTVLMHVLILLCLVLFGFTQTKQASTLDEGLTVNFGNINEAEGLFEPAGESTNPESEAIPEPVLETKPEKALITQTNEPSVSLEDKKKKETELAKQKEKQIVKIQEQKAASIRNQAASAFGSSAGKGSSQGTGSGVGNQGSTNGNPKSDNYTGGGTGYGQFSLNGRNLNGGLPHPSYSIQEEGTVVVQITVNPKGSVIASSISLKGTNTDNSTLRNAALSAAKRARFNIIIGNQNQSGTITYHFRLK